MEACETWKLILTKLLSNDSSKSQHEHVLNPQTTQLYMRNWSRSADNTGSVILRILLVVPFLQKICLLVHHSSVRYTLLQFSRLNSITNPAFADSAKVQLVFCSILDLPRPKTNILCLSKVKMKITPKCMSLFLLLVCKHLNCVNTYNGL